MSDTTPTGNRQEGRQDADRPDVTRQDANVGVVEAARILGITTDAVRARLRRGTIEGHKIEGEWHVVIPAPQSVRQDATVDRQESDRQPDRQ